MRERAADIGFACAEARPAFVFIGTGGAVVSASIDEIRNEKGGPILTRSGRSRMLDSTVTSYKGIEIEVCYFTEGAILAETGCDPAEALWCNLQQIKHKGDVVTSWFSETQIGELEQRIESSWRGESE